jgi:hypothetical protein
LEIWCGAARSQPPDVFLTFHFSFLVPVLDLGRALSFIVEHSANQISQNTAEAEPGTTHEGKKVQTRLGKASFGIPPLGGFLAPCIV